jgi:hypothetical protein
MGKGEEMSQTLYAHMNKRKNNNKVSIEKSSVILMDLPFYVIWFFSLIAFSILSLFSVLVLIIICCGEVLF